MSWMKGLFAMALTFHIPAPPLDRYIRFMWYGVASTLAYSSMKIIPEPSLDLKVNLGGKFTIYKESPSKPTETLTESWWGGLWRAPHKLALPPDIQYFC